MNRNNSFKPFSLRCGDKLLSFESPVVMGILNATPDSFYDGGSYMTEHQWVDHAVAMAEEGAGIIDIGVVSTRPGAILMSPDQEARRLEKVVAAVRRQLPATLISVDTCYSLPARAAVAAGADIVNDISGGSFDDKMFETVAELHTPYILMHNTLASVDDPAGVKGRREFAGGYDVMEDMVVCLSKLNARLRQTGVCDVIIDPGFGFSKTLEENYHVMAHLGELRQLFPDNPLLVALSRKSMIYKLLDTTPGDALAGTVALHVPALMAGAQLLRVHDVRAARHTIEVVRQLTVED